MKWVRYYTQFAENWFSSTGVFLLNLEERIIKIKEELYKYRLGRKIQLYAWNGRYIGEGARE